MLDKLWRHWLIYDVTRVPENPSCNRVKEYIWRYDAVVRLDSKQLIITTKKPYRGTLIDTIERWFKEILGDNNIICLSPHSWWAASTKYGKHNKEITEYVLDELICIENIIIFFWIDIQRFYE